MLKYMLTAIGLGAVYLMLCMALFGADEVQVNAQIKFNPLGIDRLTTLTKFDQTGDSLSMGIQEIGTATWETVTIEADVSTPGWAFFEHITTNADANTYIEIGVTTTNGFCALYTNEFALIPLSASNSYLAICSTTNAAVTSGKLFKFIIER